MFAKIMSVCGIVGVLGMASVSGATVVMSSDLPNPVDGGNNVNNGGFAVPAELLGTYWQGTPSHPSGTTPPAGWTRNGNHVYNGNFVQSYFANEITNNTGMPVEIGHQYTLTADIGRRHTTSTTIDVYVRATQNADGTGASVDLAHVSKAGGYATLDDAVADNSAAAFQFTTETNTGLPALPTLAGYFLQVEVVTGNEDLSQFYYFDNLTVNSNLVAVPEPATAGMMGIGGLLMALKRRRGH